MPGKSNNHGGARPNCGRKPAWLAGQKTLDGRMARKPTDNKNNKPRTVEEAKRARVQESEMEAIRVTREQQAKEAMAAKRATEREEAGRRLLELSESVGRIRGGGLEDEDGQENEQNDDDDDDEDFDFDCDPASDDDDDTTIDPEGVQGRNSSRYKPPRHSPLGKYLQKQKEKIISGEQKSMLYELGKDPFISGTEKDPFGFCAAVHSTIFHWNPFVHYPTEVKISIRK
jgi:hypothetical protein